MGFLIIKNRSTELIFYLIINTKTAQYFQQAEGLQILILLRPDQISGLA